ncbi:MAG TPA: aspartate/glutamate racemase family protein [Ardenticatenaceae bacterium]|jgi:Asp/Glu/hydantoin racemase
MTKLAIIHTSPVTVEVFKALAAEVLPGMEVANWVDDSILPQLAENGGAVGEVEERLVQYTRFAEQVGADVILHACSSVGEVVARTREQVSVPVVRVDEAMAEEAVRRGERIGVAATLATTLNPTLALLRRKAEEAGKEATVEPLLVDAAYQKLLAGDREAHDEILAEALAGLAERVDVVVLAQASMARVVPRLPEAQQGKVLSSPRLAMERVREVVEGQRDQ